MLNHREDFNILPFMLQTVLIYALANGWFEIKIQTPNHIITCVQNVSELKNYIHKASRGCNKCRILDVVTQLYLIINPDWPVHKNMLKLSITAVMSYVTLF